MTTRSLSSEFKEKLHDQNCSVICDLSHERTALFVAFGGISSKSRIPGFEFFHLAKDLEVNKIFVRDLGQSWYHGGLSGISRDIGGTASFLRQKADEYGAERVVFVGNSMGGYAAVLFGALVGADLVHAFVPQTSLHNPLLVRNKERLRHLHDNFGDEYCDLRQLLQRQRPPGCIHVHFSEKNWIDVEHALYLKGHRHVVLRRYLRGGHDLVKQLRDSGELRMILLRSFDDIYRYDVCTLKGRLRYWFAKSVRGGKHDQA